MDTNAYIPSTPYIISHDRAISGTLVWYYFICKREVWLIGHEITADQDFPSLEIGRAVHEIFYKEFKKEIELNGIKLDFFKKKDKAICEVKTSSKFIESAKFQILYYLYRLKEHGIDAYGEILIPREKKIIKVFLNDKDREKLLYALNDIKRIVELEKPPEPVKIHFCNRCAYNGFCWV